MGADLGQIGGLIPMEASLVQLDQQGYERQKGNEMEMVFDEEIFRTISLPGILTIWNWRTSQSQMLSSFQTKTTTILATTIRTSTTETTTTTTTTMQMATDIQTMTKTQQKAPRAATSSAM